MASKGNKVQQTATSLSDNRINLSALLTELERMGVRRKRRTVYNWIAKGCPTAGKVNRKDWLFKIADVALWLERNSA